jgi:hypothetical protein
MNAPLEIRSVVVCDDVRRESNGKALIIGAYVGDIVLPSVPLTLSLAFYFLGKGIEPGNGTVELRIEHTRSKEPMGLATARAVVHNVPAGTSTALVLPGIPFEFDQPTELLISVLEDGQWREIDRKKVLLSESSTGTTSL